MGLWSVTLSGVGIILGAGIYVIIAEAAADAGSAVWLSFALAAVIAGATALSYAELASMFPEAGASSVYVREAFGRRPGFLIGWLRISVGVIGAGAVAIGFGGYMEDLSNASERVSTLMVIVIAGGIVIIGTRETIAVAVVMTLAEVGGLALVGLPDVGTRSLLDAPDGLLGIAAGAALVFFAFEGFEEIATLSEEVKQPSRTIPRAILLSIAISTALYILVAIVAVSVIDWQVLRESGSPLADVAAVAASERVGDTLSVIALFATANTVLMLLATSARLTYGMARRGLLPRALAVVGEARRTPWLAALIVTALAAAISVRGDIGFAAQVTNFAVFTAFLVVNAAAVWLRLQRPDASRPFRIPFAIRGIPMTAVVGGVGAAALSLSLELDAVAGGLAILAAGLIASQIAMRAPSLPAARG